MASIGILDWTVFDPLLLDGIPDITGSVFGVIVGFVDLTPRATRPSGPFLSFPLIVDVIDGDVIGGVNCQSVRVEALMRER